MKFANQISFFFIIKNKKKQPGGDATGCLLMFALLLEFENIANFLNLIFDDFLQFLDRRVGKSYL